MSVTCKYHGDVLIAALSGSIDRKRVPTISEELLQAIESARDVVIDLAAVTSVSSTGYRLLLHVYYLTTAKQSQVALVAPPPEIRSTLNATGLREFFTVCGTIEAALDGLRPESSCSSGVTERLGKNVVHHVAGDVG